MSIKGNHNKHRNLDSILEDFYHPNPNINDLAVVEMIRCWPDKSIEILITHLDSKNLHLRRKSIKALAEFGDLIIDTLVKIFLCNEKIIIRVSCLKVFVKIAAKGGSNSLFKSLIEVINICMRDEEPLIILTFVSLLRQLDVLGLEYLIRLTEDKNILKVKSAITAIGEINHPDAKSCLRGIVADESRDKLINQSAEFSLQSKL